MTQSGRSPFRIGKRILHRFALLIVTFVGAVSNGQETSVCYGTTSDGKLENGWKLPASGPNFSTYSTIGRIAGRSYVHSSVHGVIVTAYQQLANQMPTTVFVYGETGTQDGGQFKPHKTHRNGLSVDFMVPVLDSDGKSVELPTSVFNKWGYDLEFDSNGRLDELEIDFEAIAEHLYHLHVAAKEDGFDIWRVIFDPELQSFLHDSPRWPYLSMNLEFSTVRSWVRHDEHYHVDFELTCKPM